MAAPPGQAGVHRSGRDLYALRMVREGLPKYRQIAGELRAQIEGGEYAPGDRLPSKAELMKRHGVALHTVDSAIGVLRDLGLAETRQGTGTFVCDPLPSSAPSEHEVMVKRIDEIGHEVRQLREEVDALKRRGASPDSPR